MPNRNTRRKSRKSRGGKVNTRRSRRKSRKSRKSGKSKSGSASRRSRVSKSKSNDIRFDQTQSVIFDRDDWSKRAAEKWLTDNNYIVTEPDITPAEYRYRQFEPKYGSGWDFARKTIYSAAKKLPIHLNLNFNVV